MMFLLILSIIISIDFIYEKCSFSQNNFYGWCSVFYKLNLYFLSNKMLFCILKPESVFLREVFCICIWKGWHLWICIILWNAYLKLTHISIWYSVDIQGWLEYHSIWYILSSFAMYLTLGIFFFVFFFCMLFLILRYAYKFITKLENIRHIKMMSLVSLKI